MNCFISLSCSGECCVIAGIGSRMNALSASNGLNGDGDGDSDAIANAA